MNPAEHLAPLARSEPLAPAPDWSWLDAGISIAARSEGITYVALPAPLVPAVPTAVFCQPNIGTVGLTEDQALAEGRTLRVFETAFKAMKHTLSGRDERTFMKLIVDAADDRVIGVHMVGEAAGEIIQGMAVAMKAGATKAQFDTTIGIHPTSAEEFVTMREPRA